MSMMHSKFTKSSLLSANVQDQITNKDKRGPNLVCFSLSNSDYCRADNLFVVLSLHIAEKKDRGKEQEIQAILAFDFILILIQNDYSALFIHESLEIDLSFKVVATAQPYFQAICSKSWPYVAIAIDLRVRVRMW